MKLYEERTFNIPKLEGISEKAIEEHLKLYAGYVKHTNAILEKINALSPETEENIGLISGLQRRFGFEFDGMRMHEYYFDSLSGEHNLIHGGDPLERAIAGEWGSFAGWLNIFKILATIRGIGWAVLYYDPVAKRLLSAWVDEHHQGQLVGLDPILVLDMWEHAYFIDYTPAEKKKYIDAFFANLNWRSCEKNFEDAAR